MGAAEAHYADGTGALSPHFLCMLRHGMPVLGMPYFTRCACAAGIGFCGVTGRVKGP